MMEKISMRSKRCHRIFYAWKREHLIFVARKLKHRSKIEIIADILENIRNNSNISTSKLMLKTFISYNQAKEYIPLLLQTELVKHDNNERSFRITNKGKL